MPVARTPSLSPYLAFLSLQVTRQALVGGLLLYRLHVGLLSVVVELRARAAVLGAEPVEFGAEFVALPKHRMYKERNGT